MTYFEVIILPSAEREIAEAYAWIADRDADAANRWYSGLSEIILSLETFPERCPHAPETEFLRHEIREIFHGRRQYKYRILFTVKGKKVHILHVRHGARLALGQTAPEEET